MSGKGDTYRRVDPQKYAAGYERIFGPRCPVHPLYRGERPPTGRVLCPICLKIWEGRQ